tara:strand:- start:424 stop:978 length:555 start_codon:yes stop_codon:yes gene_type:complete
MLTKKGDRGKIDHDYEWIGLTHLPKTSWIPVPKKEYIDDMKLTGQDLMTMVEKDIPRSIVRIYGVRIQLPELFKVLIRRVVPTDAQPEVFALCTQTALASPLRSLHATLLSNIIIAERINHSGRMEVDVNPRYSDGAVYVHIKKPLRLAKIVDGSIHTLKNITIDIVYRSDKPFVHINLATYQS